MTAPTTEPQRSALRRIARDPLSRPKFQKIQSAPELASIEVDNVSRSAFLMRGVLAAGAAYGALATGPILRRAFTRAEAGMSTS